MSRSLAALIVLTSLVAVCHADLAAVQVSGRHLAANGQTISLRGIDWGWWHLSHTVYTENDMKQEASWGANVTRLAFSYGDLEEKDKDDVWKEDGFKQLDDVVRWGKKYGVYTILDMHVVPGGQNWDTYIDGGGNKVWSDPVYQKRYIDLWQEIARRYRNRPEVAAYELLNEPNADAQGQPITADRLTMVELNKRIVAAIRQIDPSKIIAISADGMSGSQTLNGTTIINDQNIIYTIHFYDGASSHWIGNATNGPGLSGTSDWQYLHSRFTALPTATGMYFMLRSSNNSGDAWFDDVSLKDSAGTELLSAHFDKDAEGFGKERGPRAGLTYDALIGHDKPGSLRIHGTPNYNSWVSPRFDVTPGMTYDLSGWVKLVNATGDTYLTLSYESDQLFSKDKLADRLAAPLAFSKKYNVPVWVGEFGCGAYMNPMTEQGRWARDCVSLFDEDGFSWTYWNYRETTGPGSMALWAENKDGSDYPVNERLLAALKTGWALNAKQASNASN